MRKLEQIKLTFTQIEFVQIEYRTNRGIAAPRSSTSINFLVRHANENYLTKKTFPRFTLVDYIVIPKTTKR